MTVEVLHDLLKRQVEEYFGNYDAIPNELLDFINAVNNSYNQFDFNTKQFEHSMDLILQDREQTNIENISGEEEKFNFEEETLDLEQAKFQILENIKRINRKNKLDSIMSAVTKNIHCTIDLQEVLDNAVKSVCDNMEMVDHLGIHMIEGKFAVLKSFNGHPSWFANKVKKIPYKENSTWKVILKGETKYSADVDMDEAVGPDVKKVGAKSFLCLPVSVEEKTIGCVNVHSFEKNAFDRDVIKMMENVVQQLGWAIRNATMAQELNDSKKN